MSVLIVITVIFFDSQGTNFVQIIELIQYNAALAIIGSMPGTYTIKLHKRDRS